MAIADLRQNASHALLWFAAGLFLCLPTLVAADFGGILRWTQYFTALALFLGFLVAVVGNILAPRGGVALSTTPRTQAVACSMIGFAIYGWSQTWSFPADTLAWLSPGSFEAYTVWAGELLGGTTQFTNIPVSIAPQDSRHAICFLLIASMVAWASPLVFGTRDRIATMLLGIAITGAVTALIGVARKLFPSFELWSFTQGGEGSPFGTFVNRNNAALLMNMAFGASLGLIVWRLHSVQRFAEFRQDSDFEPTERPDGLGEMWNSLGSSPLFVAASLCAVMCLFGVIVCGSRGGLLSLSAGCLVAFGGLGTNRKMMLGAFAAISIITVGVLFLIPDGVGDTTIDEIGESLESDSERLQGEGRLAHWPDGWRTFRNHLPMGSGLSTYAYAYLPYQQTSPWRWYHHADNLWLEMIVELGMGGIVLFGLMGWVVLRGVLRLRHSHDPIDEGVRIGALYVVAIVLVSQTFDFGLIVPANLIVATMFLSSVVARGAAVYQPSARKRKTSKQAKSDRSTGGKK